MTGFDPTLKIATTSASSMVLTDATVNALAAGVFARPDPLVVEAYSEPDREPKQFASAERLAAYIKVRISQPQGLAFVFVVYPDMGGRAVRKTIHLDPKSCPGQKVRYTWEGWGLISVQLYGGARQDSSRVAANSSKRADQWSATHPELDPPDRWNWQAVESHTRRLQRLLKKVT